MRLRDEDVARKKKLYFVDIIVGVIGAYHTQTRFHVFCVVLYEVDCV